MKKKFILIIVTLLLCASSFAAVTVSFNSGVLTFTGTGPMPAVSTWGVGKDQITDVVIEAGVTNIIINAFDGCTDLQTVLIENGSEMSDIKAGAFRNCNQLSSITIPASVESIGGNAFQNCTSLQNLSFENGSNLGEIGSNAFKDCNQLSTVIIPASVMYIQNNAFANCTNLFCLDFEVGSQLMSIGDYTFANCRLFENIYLPGSIIEMGEYVFSNSAIHNLHLSWADPDLVTFSTPFLNFWVNSGMTFHVPAGTVSVYENSVFCDLYINDVTIVEKPTFATSGTIAGTSLYWDIDSNGLLTISGSGDIPSSLPWLGMLPWYGNPDIKSIYIGAGVTSIGSCAFETCKGLQSVTFESGSQLTSIGSYAFSGCIQLSSVTIPASVEIIDPLAFDFCKSLRNIYLSWDDPASVTYGHGIFYSCNLSNISIHIPSGTGTDYVNSFWGDLFDSSNFVEDNNSLRSFAIAADHFAYQEDMEIGLQKGMVNDVEEISIIGYEYYTLSGVKLGFRPTERGMIYIERVIMSNGNAESRKLMNR